MSTPDNSLQIVQITNCEKEGCCSTTEDGSAVCIPQKSAPTASTNKSVAPGLRWQNLRGGVMLAVACAASPCCTPLIIPIVIALLAGTPAALWIGHNLGIVYGGLTLLSVISFMLAFRWLGARRLLQSR